MTMNQLVVVAAVLITLVLISPDGDCTTGGKGVLSVLLVSGFSSYLSSAQQQSYFRRQHHRRHHQKTKTTTTTRQALRSNNNDSKENGEGVMITIEYCPGCRWMTKSFWLATEIFQKFNSNSDNKNDSNNSSQIKGITIIPSLPGTFKVTAQTKNNNNDYYYNQILWDREVDNGFPPMDLIQFEQRVENYLNPDRSLLNYLYSQSLLQKEKNDNAVEEEDKEEDKSSATTNTNYATTVKAVKAIEAGTEPQIVIRFGNSSPTNQQQYLFRSIYYGQELFTTFNDGEIKSIALLPTTTTTDTTNHNHNNGRHFSIELKMDDNYSSIKIDDDDDNKEICLWDNNNDNLRKDDDSPTVKSALSLFPEVKVLKRLVRNYVNSEKDLGHSEEGKDNSNTNSNTKSNDDDTTKITTGEEKKIEDIKNAIIALQQVLIEIGSSSTTTTTTNDTNTIIVVKENDENDAEEEEDAENQRRYFGVL